MRTRGRLLLLSLALLALAANAAASPGEAVDLLLAGGTVVTMDQGFRVVEDGAVAVKGERIVAVGPAPELRARYTPARAIDTSGRIVMPGLVNTHSHVPMTLLRGVADDVELMVWLTKYIWPAEAAHVTPEFVTWGTRLAAWEMIRTGTTTFSDMYFYEDQVAEAAKQAGLRGFCAATVMDHPVPGLKDAEEGLRVAEAFLKKWSGDPLIVPALGPHAAYTVGPQTLLRVKALADRYQAPMMIHAAESPSEMTLVREKYGTTTVAHLDKIGFLGPNLTLAHAIWLTDDEIATIAARGVGTAHCPSSNTKLASGVSPVPKLRKAGVRAGLGTDGPSSNNDLNMFEEIDLALKLHKITSGDPAVLSARDGVEMATIGGARALHLEREIGSLEPGKRADLIVLASDAPWAQPRYDVYAQLAYAIKGSDVATTIVNGRVLMEDGRMLTLDTAAITARVRRYRDEIAVRLPAR
ncbi:MAG TPA: amidohydrolase [Vicinamibacteria bacterium]|jgi:5-methylthioadenosine/S-adenosylhomocysteine deaminase